MTMKPIPINEKHRLTQSQRQEILDAGYLVNATVMNPETNKLNIHYKKDGTTGGAYKVEIDLDQFENSKQVTELVLSAMRNNNNAPIYPSDGSGTKKTGKQGMYSGKRKNVRGEKFLCP